jgi:hypothetical protein
MPSGAIKTSRAALVVPPGLVTASRSFEAGSCESRASSPEPAIVARESLSQLSDETAISLLFRRLTALEMELGDTAHHLEQFIAAGAAEGT